MTGNIIRKIKQNNLSLNIDRSKTSVNINGRMDMLIRASKIANQNAGEVEVIVLRDNNIDLKTTRPILLNAKSNWILLKLIKKKSIYLQLPKCCDFGGEENKRIFLLKNIEKIYKEIDNL